MKRKESRLISIQPPWLPFSHHQAAETWRTVCHKHFAARILHQSSTPRLHAFSYINSSARPSRLQASQAKGSQHWATCASGAPPPYAADRFLPGLLYCAPIRLLLAALEPEHSFPRRHVTLLRSHIPTGTSSVFRRKVLQS